MRLKTASGNSETVLRSVFPLRDNFRFLCKATAAADASATLSLARHGPTVL